MENESRQGFKGYANDPVYRSYIDRVKSAPSGQAIVEIVRNTTAERITQCSLKDLENYRRLIGICRYSLSEYNPATNGL